MKLIHVIDTHPGLVTRITSFVVRESDRKNVKRAEKLFKESVKDAGGKLKDADLDDLSWSNLSGHSISVQWSNSVIE
jgi:hypothetical protein